MSTTPKKCNYPKCANKGTFEGENCPGSDDDDIEDEPCHHCVDCGQLWWVGNADACDICGDWWCSDWQNTFILLTDPCKNTTWDEKETGYLEEICSKCFLNDKQFWCQDPENCKCDQKYQEVHDNWTKWLSRK